ncbi:hypothetical protein CFC21_018480 [Triticum aestivum]|uniref:Thioesterase domain-containing protein n=3 Tax=Triticum TaxID=4564 RepID=A0A9R1P2B5_TRITD|nr:hypothetical protein CFC21_018480 [Triticum aestivum]VAH35431.1 unnamed protein product [Triticum turgidum subsp. durum]
MQQIGALIPLATHQFPQHPCRVYTTGGGRSNYCQLVMPVGQAYLLQHQVKAAPRAPTPLQTVTTVNTNQDSTIRKDKYFEVEMKVHDTELDKYGVVNNAIYSSYIRNGHDKLLESLGISVDSMVSKGSALALSEVHLKYIAPLRHCQSGDRFVVKVKLGQIKGVRLILEHTIETLPDHKLVLEDKGTLVCLDKDYHPTRIFPEVSTKFLQFFSSKDD